TLFPYTTPFPPRPTKADPATPVPAPRTPRPRAPPPTPLPPPRLSRTHRPSDRRLRTTTPRTTTQGQPGPGRPGPPHRLAPGLQPGTPHPVPPSCPQTRSDLRSLPPPPQPARRPLATHTQPTHRTRTRPKRPALRTRSVRFVSFERDSTQRRRVRQHTTPDHRPDPPHRVARGGVGPLATPLRDRSEERRVGKESKRGRRTWEKKQRSSKAKG